MNTTEQLQLLKDKHGERLGNDYKIIISKTQTHNDSSPIIDACRGDELKFRLQSKNWAIVTEEALGLQIQLAAVEQVNPTVVNEPKKEKVAQQLAVVKEKNLDKVEKDEPKKAEPNPDEVIDNPNTFNEVDAPDGTKGKSQKEEPVEKGKTPVKREDNQPKRSTTRRNTN